MGQHIRDHATTHPMGDAVWASDVLAETIGALGYGYVSLVPGSSFRGLHDSIVNHLSATAPEMVVCLHELQAVFIAEGYARATDRPMAVALHANVGLMNGTMGIYDTWCNRQPMLVIGATGPVDAAKRRPWIDWVHTARDQGALVRDYVKWDDQPASAQAAMESLIRADQIARSEPCGPVYVCLDAAMQEAKIEAKLPIPDVSRFPVPATPAAPQESVNAVVAALKTAECPVILFGRGARSQTAWENRVALAEVTGAIVMSNLHGAASFPTAHPQHVLQPVGERPRQPEIDLLKRADLVVSFDWHDLAGFLAARNDGAQNFEPFRGQIVHCSLDLYIANGWSMDHQALPAVDIPILAGPDQLVAQLLDAIGDKNFPDRATGIVHWTEDAREMAASVRETNLRVQDVSFIVTETLAERPVTYARLPFGFSSLAARFKGPLDFLGKDAGGTVGSGPGHSVGTALALKDTGRLVVGIIGDGDFAIGMQALWTATHMDVPLLMIVANNHSYYNDEIHQQRVARHRDRPTQNAHVGVRLEPGIDNCAIACAQGFEAIGPIADANELRSALNKAADAVMTGKRILIDVTVEPGYGNE